jgi:hypothetical protein
VEETSSSMKFTIGPICHNIARTRPALEEGGRRGGSDWKGSQRNNETSSAQRSDLDGPPARRRR